MERVVFDLTLTPYDVVRIRSRDADDYGSVSFVEGKPQSKGDFVAFTCNSIRQTAMS
jgi:hypothetical protein